jgi:hypothetical protein
MCPGYYLAFWRRRKGRTGAAQRVSLNLDSYCHDKKFKLPCCLEVIFKTAGGSGEPKGNGAASRFPFPLPQGSIGEYKANIK